MLTFFYFDSEILKLKIIGNSEEWPFLQYAKFSEPENSIVIVYKNNIYYSQGSRFTEVFQISNDGVPGTIYNGIPDWLYEGKFNL